MSHAKGIILARWQTSLENAACSPLELYQMVENSLMATELPNLRFSTITRPESGWFSARRIYLRISYERLFFDVSAFLSGNVLVIGWWLHQNSLGVVDLLAEIPGVGFLLERTICAATYYQIDYLEYFQHTVHALVLKVVDELREENGLPVLLNEARTPVWEEIW